MYKLVQKQTYTFLSHRYGMILIFMGLVIVIISAFHFGESSLEWSRDQYSQLFNIYHDNIAGKAFQNRMCLPIPIDAVYTWVNGSDPKLIADLQRVKDKLEIDRTKETKKSTESIQCKDDNCVPGHMIIFSIVLPSSVQMQDLAESHTGFLQGDRVFNVTKSARMNITVVQFETQSIVNTIMKENPFIMYMGRNISLSKGYLTSDWQAENAMELQDVAFVSNVGKNVTGEEIRTKIPADQRENVKRIDLMTSAGVAVITLKSAEVTRTFITEFEKSEGEEGMKVGGAYLLWGLESNKPAHEEDVARSRFEDNEEMRYSLRSLEQNAPWIRHVYIVTNGQIPSWLNLDNPRITLVTHEDIFPNKSHLPTFSSPAIESHLHQIPGLSDKFVYLNDDTMFGVPVWPDDFYTHSRGQKIYLTWPVPNCAEGCPPSWIRDNYCDTACNNSECDWDGGDCSGVAKAGPVGAAGGGDSLDFTDMYCTTGCANGWIADRYCDQTCNNAQCGFDAGDCGVDNFGKLYGVDIKGPVNITIPQGIAVLYLNLTTIFSGNSSITDAHYLDTKVIRTATVAQKYKLITLLLYANMTDTMICMNVMGVQDLIPFNVTFNVTVNTIPITERALTVVKPEDEGEVKGELDEIWKVLLSDVPEDDRGPKVHQKLQPPEEPPAIDMQHISEEMTAKLAELDTKLTNGDITEKGHQKFRVQLLREYLQSPEYTKNLQGGAYEGDQTKNLQGGAYEGDQHPQDDTAIIGKPDNIKMAREEGIENMDRFKKLKFSDTEARLRHADETVGRQNLVDEFGHERAPQDTGERDRRLGQKDQRLMRKQGQIEPQHYAQEQGREHQQEPIQQQQEWNKQQPVLQQQQQPALQQKEQKQQQPFKQQQQPVLQQQQWKQQQPIEQQQQPVQQQQLEQQKQPVLQQQQWKQQQPIEQQQQPVQQQQLEQQKQPVLQQQQWKQQQPVEQQQQWKQQQPIEQQQQPVLQQQQWKQQQPVEQQQQWKQQQPIEQQQQPVLQQQQWKQQQPIEQQQQPVQQQLEQQKQPVLQQQQWKQQQPIEQQQQPVQQQPLEQQKQPVLQQQQWKQQKPLDQQQQQWKQQQPILQQQQQQQQQPDIQLEQQIRQQQQWNQQQQPAMQQQQPAMKWQQPAMREQQPALQQQQPAMANFQQQQQQQLDVEVQPALQEKHPLQDGHRPALKKNLQQQQPRHQIGLQHLQQQQPVETQDEKKETAEDLLEMSKVPEADGNDAPPKQNVGNNPNFRGSDWNAPNHGQGNPKRRSNINRLKPILFNRQEPVGGGFKQRGGVEQQELQNWNQPVLINREPVAAGRANDESNWDHMVGNQLNLPPERANIQPVNKMQKQQEFPDVAGKEVNQDNTRQNRPKLVPGDAGLPANPPDEIPVEDQQNAEPKQQDLPDPLNQHEQDQAGQNQFEADRMDQQLHIAPQDEEKKQIVDFDIPKKKFHKGRRKETGKKLMPQNDDEMPNIRKLLSVENVQHFRNNSLQAETPDRKITQQDDTAFKRSNVGLSNDYLKETAFRKDHARTDPRHSGKQQVKMRTNAAADGVYSKTAANGQTKEVGPRQEEVEAVAMAMDDVMDEEAERLAEEVNKYIRKTSFLPWERIDTSKPKKKDSGSRSDYQTSGFRSRHTLDTFADSLIHVNRLYNKRFGFISRKVPGHIPHMIDVNIMNALQAEFPAEFNETSSHQVRHSKDMQFAFSYMYYVIGSPKEVDTNEIFDEFDTDHSGVLSDREIRTLATRLFELPLDLQTLSSLENNFIQCAKNLSKSIFENPSLMQEKYYEEKMPQVTKALVAKCTSVTDLMKKSVKGQTNYKHEVVGDDDIAFKMIRTNVSQVIGQLDDIRKNPKKFVCLNDNIDHSSADAYMVKAVLQDFYEALFPIVSQFELPREYRNRFLHVDELREWRRYRDWLRFWTQISLLGLIVFSIASFCSRQVMALKRRCCPRRRTKMDEIAEKVQHV